MEENTLGFAFDDKEKCNDWVYLLRHPFDKSLYKIGSTTHLWSRLRSLVTHMGGNFESILRDHAAADADWTKNSDKWADLGEPDYRPEEFPFLVYKYQNDNNDSSFDISAKNLETHLHKMFKQHRTKGEWFAMTTEVLNEVDKEIISCDYCPYVDLYEVFFHDFSDRAPIPKTIQKIIGTPITF